MEVFTQEARFDVFWCIKLHLTEIFYKSRPAIDRNSEQALVFRAPYSHADSSDALHAVLAGKLKSCAFTGKHSSIKPSTEEALRLAILVDRYRITQQHFSGDWDRTLTGSL
jgi:hypothetical protein